MKRIWLGLTSFSLLIACAPTQIGDRDSGRIVNIDTGEEGTVRFGGPGRIANVGQVVLRFGEEEYVGRYNVLAAADAPRRSTISAGIGFSNVAPPAWYLTTIPEPVSNLRDGSLVARNEAGRVISCRFVVDQYSRGNGECLGGQGARYAIQF